MSLNDLSQISDISCISRISRVNCSRIMGRIDLFPNLLEQQSTSRNIGNQNQESVLQKAVKRLAICDDSIGNHIKNKIILQCIRDTAMNLNETLSKDVVNKLEKLILKHELNKYMHLLPTKTQNKLTLLGITDFPESNLTYEETLDVKCYVEALLREKIHNFIQSYECLGGNMKEVTRSNECNMRKKLFQADETELLKWKEKIEKLCEQYTADIDKSQLILNKWNSLKYEDLNKIYMEKAGLLLLEAQVAEIKTIITKLSCMTRTFKEVPITIDAYKTLNATVDDKLFAIANEIKERKHLKRQYDSLENTEYNSILNTYSQLCKAVQKNKELLEKL